jgi:molybdopterin-binding protein
LTRTPIDRNKGQSVLCRLPDAAALLSVSVPTLKQWIADGKLRSVKTPGGHHRLPRTEIDRLAGRTPRQAVPRSADPLAAISGRNKLLGTVSRVRFGGLLAEVTLSVAGHELTAIITRESCRAMGLKAGMRAFGLVKATAVMIIRA